MREGGRDGPGWGGGVMFWRRRRDAEKEERLKLRRRSSAGGGDESYGSEGEKMTAMLAGRGGSRNDR